LAEAVTAFDFKQHSNIIKSTGRRASNLRELRDVIATVGDDSIFHHTYQYFLKGHILEYTNDFAQWAGENLEERALAERLSNIDPYDFRNITELRKELVQTIDEYLEKFPEPREAMPGDEFYFNETISLTFHVGIRALNLAEFLLAIKYVDTGSIYYHFYEARVRLGSGVDDFSSWVENVLGKKDLAERIRSIDLFMHSVEGIRDHIIQEVEAEVKNDMEVISG
jgi:hypothetical protein